MKIAVDVRCLMEEQFSGVGQYALQVLRAMTQVADQHEYHAFYNSFSSVRLPELGHEVYVHRLPYPNKVFHAGQWALSWPRWDRLLPDMDVFFVPSLRLMPLPPEVPLVSVVHDLSFEHFPELFNVKRRLWHAMMRPRELARCSNAIIAVSQHTKQDVVNLYDVPEEKVHVIYSGVSEARERNFSARLALRPQTGEAAHAYSPKKFAPSPLPQKFILYLGTLEPRKNVDSLIRAYSLIADRVEQDLVIAGPRGWSMGEIKAALAQSPCRSRIHILGFVREEDKSALYAAADLFVYPSFYEGFGFPPLEALMAGTPVVTSFNSALPEVVGKWATLIDPYDTGELALVIKELLHELPVVTPEVQQAVQEKYSWDRAGKQTLAVLESVVYR